MNTNTLSQANAHAIIDALNAEGGRYIDDHRRGAEKLATAQWYGLFDRGDGQLDAFIGYSKTVFCINQTYLDEQGRVHVSTSSIGGNVRCDMFVDDVEGAVEHFNELQAQQPLNADARITSFYFPRPSSKPVLEGHSPAHTTFLKTFHSTHKPLVELPFNPEWANGTGYFDGLAVMNVGLAVGTRFRSQETEEESERRIIGIVTPVGNVVFFERLEGGEGGTVVINLPRALTGLYETGMQTAEVISQAVGGAEGWSTNIGQVLANVATQLAPRSTRS